MKIGISALKAPMDSTKGRIKSANAMIIFYPASYKKAYDIC